MKRGVLEKPGGLLKSSLPIGFTARNATMADIPAAVRLFNIYDEYYLGFKGFTVNILETDWKTPKFCPEKDIHLVFDPMGELVGYIEVSMFSEPPVHPWVWGRVHPEYNGNGIGTYLMNWAENHAREAIQRCPKDARVAYFVGTDSNIKPPKRLFKALGLKLIRHSFRMLIQMDEPPPKPVLPKRITIQAITDPENEIKTLCRLDIEAFRDHFGYIEPPFEDHLARMNNWLTNDERVNDPSLWFLAKEGDTPVGFALCAKWDREDKSNGYVCDLGVLRPYRKRGIGLALLHHAFGEFYRRGKQGVSLGVDAENLTGALRLYKKAGMHVHRQFDLYEKELRPGVEYSVESLEDS